VFVWHNSCHDATQCNEFRHAHKCGGHHKLCCSRTTFDHKLTDHLWHSRRHGQSTDHSCRLNNLGPITVPITSVKH
jgi:hypothetical protein